MIQDTSLRAFYALQSTLGRAQKEVLDALRSQVNATNAEIAWMLNHRPINTITPRTFELREIGLVEEAGKRKCRVSGRTAIAWRAVPMPSAMKPVESKGQPLFS